jgi:hypothetical protein
MLLLDVVVWSKTMLRDAAQTRYPGTDLILRYEVKTSP